MDQTTSLLVFLGTMIVMYVIYAMGKMADHFIPKERQEHIMKIVKLNGSILLVSIVLTAFINGCYTIYKVLA